MQSNQIGEFLNVILGGMYSNR